NATSSDLSFDSMVWGEEATLPVVTTTSPTNDQAFRIGSNITVNVSSTTFVTNINFLSDGLFVGQDGTRPFSGVVSNLAIGSHTITVQGDDQFGNQAQDSVTIRIVGNTPPTLTIGSPSAVTNVLVGSTVLITNVVPTDSDGIITRVDFYLDNQLYFTAPTSPYWMEVGDLLAGSHLLTAVAIDNDGASASASVSLVATNPPGASLLITNGASWKYFDLGIDPGANWFSTNFTSEASWSNGVAELGFGDELLTQQHRPQQTVISRTNAAGAVIAAYYFRHHFNVADPSTYNNLLLNVLRDDGAVVYLNGTEIFRSNFTNNPAYYTNLAPVAASDDGAIYQKSTNAISPSLLVAGDNLIAVEIHQDSLTSSDISFDLMLWATEAAAPRLFISSNGSSVDVTWAGTGFTLQQNSDLGNPALWQAVSGNPQNTYHFTPASNEPVRFFRLIK
ncbi:MAG TPA: Ig-like domain-containing protein, partial [Candidatus Saccharimonadales bacterium]|nr:Ig-like domain-containing protein [Candidatus Saccharimonadales bacterium]